MLMMDKSTSSTRPQQPLGWLIKLLPASKRSTDGCPRTVWSWILRKHNSSGWAVDNSFRMSASIAFISATMPLLPSQRSAISGFILTANWQWGFTCSVSAGHHSTSFGNSDPCVARFPLMHVQPLCMHSLPAGLITVTACWLVSEMVYSINCRLWCEWRPALSSGSASSIQSRQTFVIVYTGSPSVQESTSSWVFSFTSVSMVSLIHTSRRCLYRNQLFRPSPVFARRREVISLCREQKPKRLGHEALPLLGLPSGTICLTIWGTLPWVYLFSNKDWNHICLNNFDVWYSLNWHLPPHSS